MKTTLVTGAPGWLGTRLVEALTGKAPELTSFSYRGVRPVRVLAFPGMNAAEISIMGAEIATGDVRDETCLEPALKDVDTVFHCVGVIHPKRLHDLFDTNAQGTKNLLEASIAAGVEKFIFISSNSPAGCNPHRYTPLKENDPLNPYKAYGKSKALAEDLVNEAHEKRRLKTVILRPCWFYGPNQPARQSRFFRMIKSGRPLVFGDGYNLRSMSYIDNTIQGMLRAESVHAAAGKTYWVADGRPYATLEIYQTVADLLGVKLNPRFVPAWTSKVCEWIDDALQSVGLYSTDFHVAGEMIKDIACSIEKARRELGYEPTVSLREGMRRSIEWCRGHGQDI